MTCHARLVRELSFRFLGRNFPLRLSGCRSRSSRVRKSVPIWLRPVHAHAHSESFPCPQCTAVLTCITTSGVVFFFVLTVTAPWKTKQAEDYSIPASHAAFSVFRTMIAAMCALFVQLVTTSDFMKHCWLIDLCQPIHQSNSKAY